MWKIVQMQNSLNGHAAIPATGDVVKGMEIMHNAILRDLSTLDSSRHTSMRFEELESSPAEVMKRVYNSIGLLFTPSLAGSIEKFSCENGTFRKNCFSVNDSDRKIIESGLPAYREYFGYS
jgi:hypothetical protein